MTDIRKLPAENERVETGTVQFGEDWPGVFIRGDMAAYYAMVLRSFLEPPERVRGFTSPTAALVQMQLRDLHQLLSSCVVGPASETVQLRRRK